MTWSVYGHGSFFAGIADASDVDVLVVTDQRLSRWQAARMMPADVYDVPLQLDITVAAPDEVRFEPIMRACVLSGRLLDGTVFEVEPFTCREWEAVMRTLCSLPSTLGTAILSQLRALWAAEGRLVLPKSAVPAEARASEHEELANLAWEHRRDPTWLPAPYSVRERQIAHPMTRESPPR